MCIRDRVERLVIMTETRVIGPEDLPFNPPEEYPDTREYPVPLSSPDSRMGLIEEVEQLERKRIVVALQASRFILQNASMTLGITPRQLGYRIRKYGITLKKL